LVAGNAAQVQQTAMNAGKVAADDVLSAASQLADQSQTLTSEVEKFLNSVRAS